MIEKEIHRPQALLGVSERCRIVHHSHGGNGLFLGLLLVCPLPLGCTGWRHYFRFSPRSGIVKKTNFEHVRADLLCLMHVVVSRAGPQP